MKKLRIFYQPDRPVGNRLIQFKGFRLKFIIRAGSNWAHLILFCSYLPHMNSKSYTISFFGLLSLQGTFYQIFRFFLNRINQLGTVQPVHRASLHGALLLLILGPKSYLVRAHKPQISPRHGLGLVLGYVMGSCNPPWVHFNTWWLRKEVSVASYGPWE